MIIAKADDIKGLITPAPHIRELKVLLSPELQDGVRDFSVGMTVLPPGESTSSHAHEHETEAWLVLDGQGEVIVEGKKAEAESGTVVYLPPGQSHQMINTGDRTLRFFWVYSPPGAENVVLDGSMK